MRIFCHRRNSKEKLISTPPEFGVEIDIRTIGTDLVLHHDPFTQGVLLADWLDDYAHSGLILNLKEDGLESQLLSIMKEREIDDFFFLDQSYPSMVKSLRNNLADKVAARSSEYESLESIKSLPQPPAYIWCDSFNGNWIHLLPTLGYAIEIKSLCVIVSPELQSRESNKEISEIKELLSVNMSNEIAVCTKNPELWK